MRKHENEGVRLGIRVYKCQNSASGHQTMSADRRSIHVRRMLRTGASAGRIQRTGLPSCPTKNEAATQPSCCPNGSRERRIIIPDKRYGYIPKASYRA